jgi:hypothetical protein
MRATKHIIFIFISIGWISPANAQVSNLNYSSAGATYTQNFDGLPLSGSFSLAGKGPFNLSTSPVNAVNLAGWQIWMPTGSNPNAAFAPGTGSSTGNGVYSLGTAGSTDRALGSLSSSTAIYSFGLIITNTTGIALNNITVSCTVEQWRRGGSGNRNTWSFRYKTGNFSSIDQVGLSNETILDMFSISTSGAGGSLNGNLPDNRLQLTVTLQHINWKNGEQLLLRWDDADETGSDDVCALDDFNLTAWQTTAAPLVSISPVSAVNATSATLTGSVNDQFATTTAFFEYDTSTTFTEPKSLPANPGIISQGAGTIPVTADISGLATGVQYYFRIKASNSSGTTYSNTQQFTTAFGLPLVVTAVPVNITTNSALLGGSIHHTGGVPITDQGIVWSLTDTGNGTPLSMTMTTPFFSGTAEGLPPGKLIYAKAYASNQVGTTYGNLVSFTTATTIVSLVPTDPLLSNAASVHFNLRTAENIAGISAANFVLANEGIADAAITSINGSGTQFTITVSTGTGDGNMLLRFTNDSNLSPAVYNKPFNAVAVYQIDKSPPFIRSVNIPDNYMKLGDSVTASIYVKPDTARYKLSSGKINNLSLTGFTKRNDSLYTGVFIISSSTANIPAEGAIPVSIVLTDPAGNSNIAYQTPITQTSDAIDVIRPYITGSTLPEDSLYKTGDTLAFVIRFNEKVLVTSLATVYGFSSTIGSRTKLVNYLSGNGTDSLLFRYIIPAGEQDNDGIRINSPLPLVNMEIRDQADNTATLSYTFPSTKNILVDAVSPTITGVITPPAAVYRTGNLLDFVVSFSEKIWIADDSLQLPLLIGNTTRYAIYTSGSGSSSLLFRYVIEESDIDKDGIKLASSLYTTTAIRDAAGNAASNTVSNIGALSAVLINPPTIAVKKLILPPDNTYRSGDTLEFAVLFNENAFVDTRNGIPVLRITIGSTVKQALYTEGSGSNTLLFQYAIQKNELDTNGISLSPSISFNNGTIKDEKGNAVPPTISNIGNTTGIQVDAADPYVKNVITPVKKTYATGDTLDFTVNFSENVFIAQPDSIYIGMTIGNTLRKAGYVGGNATGSLLFRYIVKTGDLDKNGIKIDSSINGSSVTDKWGNKLLSSLENIGAVSGIRIDGMAPVFIEKNSELTVCENSEDISITALLSVMDGEDNEILSWQLSNPANGIISRSSATANSNAKTVLPPVVYYRPSANTQGRDSIVAVVNDGVHLSQKTILIFIQPAITNNRTGAAQIICAGNIPDIISGSVPGGGDGNYLYQWESASGAEAVSFVKASGNNSLSYYLPAKLNTSTWFRRKIFSGGCQDISAPTKIEVVKNGLWTGHYSSYWNNPNNWCSNFIPDQTTDVLINAGTSYSPEISDSAGSNQLQLATGATLRITGLLKLRSSIKNNGGTIDAATGSILLNGIDTQTLPAEIFKNNSVKNLLINNPAGVILAGPLAITGSLTLNSGSLLTNNQLWIRPGAGIGPSATGTIITGKINMEKPISTKRKTFQLLGHPFAGSLAVSMFTDSNKVALFDTNGATDPFLIDSAWTTPDTHTPNQDQWREFTATRISVTDTISLHFSGIPHTGNQEISFSQTNKRSFHTAVNPYPAPVDLSKLTRSTGIGTHYWLWNTQQGLQGGYTAMPFNVPSVIDPFGVFFIRSDGSNASLLFTENSKSASYSKDSLPALHTDVAGFIELRVESDSIFWDRILLINSDSAGSYYDPDDAEKLWNRDLNFYSISRDKQKLSVDTRPIGNTSVISLGITSLLSQNFRIRVAALNMPEENTLQLHDRWLGKWMKLEKDSCYSFAITTDTSSNGEQRFEIATFRARTDTGVLPKLITRIMPVPAHETALISFSSPEKAHTVIRLLSLTGIPLRQVDLGIQQNGQYSLPLAGLSPGIYLIELRCGEQTAIQKLIKN